jgi:YspA, cpYpsA-related SLOG family
MVLHREGRKMIIAVTGWRHHADRDFIRGQLGGWLGPYPLHVRVGDASGTDAIVASWCQDNGISHKVFRADWDRFGKHAGPMRNRDMLAGKEDYFTGPTQLLLAFPRYDGEHILVPGSGTWGCVIEAFQRGIRVEIPAYTRRENL